jgi:hypothetical protein
MTLIFEQERILTIVDVIYLKFVDPTTIQTVISVQALPAIGHGNIVMATLLSGKSKLPLFLYLVIIV